MKLYFFFQRRHYNNGWAKALRGHPYCGAYIDQRYLHRDLHSVCHDVPCPSGTICRRVYNEICRQEKAGLISLTDPPWLRLENIAALLEEDCPITASILRWQKTKIQKFYSTRSVKDLENSKPLDDKTPI